MEHLIGQGPASDASAKDLIKDTTERTFAKDVIEASREVPVIIDFWAPWCGPCKTLGPMIEKAVLAAKGKVRLVKIDVDQNQMIARQLRIQSIPAVFAFHNGQPVDGFVGAVPESQIKSFVQRLAALAGESPIDQTLNAAAQAMDEGALEEAAEAFSSVLEVEPQNPKALGGLAKVFVTQGNLDQARAVLDQVNPDHAQDPAVTGAEAALSLARQALPSSEVDGLTAAVEADANNHQARFDLSLALIGQGAREAAVDHLLEIVKRNRAWEDEAARKQLIKLFEAFGPMDPLTQQARKRLSSILFA
jgi:putative thioredoxin